MKKDEQNPIDELARTSESLRRATERAAEKTAALEVADRVYKQAGIDLDLANADVERLRTRVLHLASKLHG